LRILPLIAALCFCTAAASAASAAGAAGAAGKSADVDLSDRAGLDYGNYLSARFAADNHDLEEAARFFIASLEHDPSDPQLLAGAFYYSAGAGLMDDAPELAGRVVTDVPDDRLARLVLAVNAMRHGKYKAARSQIAKSAKGPFTSFTVALLDGWAAAGAGDADDAAGDLDSLHAQHSADALAFFNEAMLFEMLGKKDKAATYYEQAFATPGGATPRVADAYGRFLERNGRTAEARAFYEKLSAEEAFKTVSGPGLLRLAKGTIPPPLVQTPAQGAAEALFGIAASLNDDVNRDISIIYLRLALSLNPKLDLATMLLANRYEAIGKFEDAIALYRGIAEDSPLQSYAGLATALDLARLDKTDEAIASLKTLAAANPSGATIWTALGDAYRQAGKFPDAVKAYDRALEAQPGKRSWTLYYTRAIALQESGNWPAAESDLKDALKLSPNEPQILNFLGYSWVDKKRNIKEALAMLEKARALSPQDGYIIDSVGWAYYRLGRYEDAAETLQAAVQLIPGDPTINDHLGDALWRTGRKLDAQFQWSHALAFGAEADEKAKIQKKLQVGLSRNDKS
jgi:tetratricopeptide (TPR) repeat protein